MLRCQLLEAEEGGVGTAWGAEEVAVVKVRKDVDVVKLELQLAEDGVEGEGKEPGAMGVTLAAAVAGGDVGARALGWAVSGGSIGVSIRCRCVGGCGCGGWGRGAAEGVAVCKQWAMLAVEALDGG